MLYPQVLPSLLLQTHTMTFKSFNTTKNKFRLLSKKPLKAVSLIEVLAILVLTGVLLLATARMTSSLLIQLRNNEIEDYANGLALQALEAAKSPNNISVSALPNTSGSAYKILLNPGGSSKLDRTVSFLASPNNSGCSTSNTYYVNSAAVSGYGQVPVCIQIIIKTQTNPYNSTSYYQLTARVSYTIPSKSDNFDISSYRYAGFNVQP